MASPTPSLGSHTASAALEDPVERTMGTVREFLQSYYDAIGSASSFDRIFRFYSPVSQITRIMRPGGNFQPEKNCSYGGAACVETLKRLRSEFQYPVHIFAWDFQVFGSFNVLITVWCGQNLGDDNVRYFTQTFVVGIFESGFAILNDSLRVLPSDLTAAKAVLVRTPPPESAGAASAGTKSPTTASSGAGAATQPSAHIERKTVVPARPMSSPGLNGTAAPASTASAAAPAQPSPSPAPRKPESVAPAPVKPASHPKEPPKPSAAKSAAPTPAPVTSAAATVAPATRAAAPAPTAAPKRPEKMSWSAIASVKAANRSPATGPAPAPAATAAAPVDFSPALGASAAVGPAPLDDASAATSPPNEPTFAPKLDPAGYDRSRGQQQHGRGPSGSASGSSSGRPTFEYIDGALFVSTSAMDFPPKMEQLVSEYFEGFGTLETVDPSSLSTGRHVFYVYFKKKTDKDNEAVRLVMERGQEHEIGGIRFRVDQKRVRKAGGGKGGRDGGYSRGGRGGSERGNSSRGRGGRGGRGAPRGGAGGGGSAAAGGRGSREPRRQ